MKTALVVTLAACLVSGSVASAQPYGGDYFVSTYDYNPTPHCCILAGLYRLTPAGQVTTLIQYVGRGGWLNFPPQMDATNRHLITASWLGIYEWDATTHAPLTSIFTMNYITGFSAHHANGFAMVDNGVLVHLTPDLQTWTRIATLHTGSFPILSIHGQELWSGDYIIVDDISGAASLVSTDGKQTRPVGAFHSGYTSAAIVQSHLDGDFRIFSSSGLLRLDPRTMTRTTLASGSFLPSAATFDRATGQGAISMLTGNSFNSTLHRMDPTGRMISTSPPIVFRSYPFMIRHALDRDLAAIRQASPNLWRLRLNCPSGAGRPYTIAISMTGFTPGVPAGGRTIPLVPDPVFFMSVQGRLAPWLSGNVGRLSATGFALATLDLRRFGTALAGTKLWAAAVVLDPAAPAGLSLVTRPIVLVLD